ncbi:MAG: acylneuraminate cytidylyltransferase family protein [Thermoplasmatales archaeon]|nr:acylneuraminate cytidylyltransferase family protein [Thermoplasmatales archaeon]
MSNKQKTKNLAIIPARGGSKGIPRKNIIKINGKPLIQYTIEVAKESKLIDRVIVSTDDDEIAKISKKLGAEVPFIRPAELAKDDTPTFPVIKHALKWLKENENYMPDLIVLLEPTFPLRTVEKVDEAIKVITSDEEADSLRGVCEPFQNPFKMWVPCGKYLEPLIKENETMHEKPRQNLKKVLWQNGYIYISRYRTIMDKKSFHGEKVLPFILSKNSFIDIDTEEDLKLMKCYLEK